jgi:hypothetical protein
MPLAAIRRFGGCRGRSPSDSIDPCVPRSAPLPSPHRFPGPAAPVDTTWPQFRGHHGARRLAVDTLPTEVVHHESTWPGRPTCPAGLVVAIVWGSQVSSPPRSARRSQAASPGSTATTSYAELRAGWAEDDRSDQEKLRPARSRGRRRSRRRGLVVLQLRRPPPARLVAAAGATTARPSAGAIARTPTVGNARHRRRAASTRSIGNIGLFCYAMDGRRCGPHIEPHARYLDFGTRRFAGRPTGRVYVIDDNQESSSISLSTRDRARWLDDASGDRRSGANHDVRLVDPVRLGDPRAPRSSHRHRRGDRLRHRRKELWR